jgi:hypothetical protein
MAYNNNNTSRNNNNQRPQKKHSGCRSKMGSNGKNVIFGWNYSRRHGLVSFVATMKNEKNLCVNKNGEELHIYVVTVTKAMQAKQTVTGFFNPNDGKLRIPDLGMTANPKANNGGYWGRTAVSKR